MNKNVGCQNSTRNYTTVADFNYKPSHVIGWFVNWLSGFNWITPNKITPINCIFWSVNRKAAQLTEHLERNQLM